MITPRQLSALFLIVFAMGACKRRTPPEAPTPAPVTDDAAMRERARADSIAAAEAARERAAREAAAAMARAREMLTDRVQFDYDSFELDPQAEERLRMKAEILRANPNIQLRVEGHADERGSTEYNLALGQRRAEAVRSFLGNYGIGTDRLSITSYGEEQPLVEGSNESAWAQNRRAEFTVTSGDITNPPPGAD